MNRSKRMRKWVKPTVVLVDSNDVCLQQAKGIIEEEKYPVLVTSSQREARDIVNDLVGPAIFIIEQYLPKVSGLQLMVELMEVTRFPIEFILFTADSDHRIFTRARRIGADYFAKGRGVKGDYNLTTGLFIEHVQDAERALKEKEGRDTDTITNAHTRRGGDTLWVPIWNRAKRHKTSTACLFADLDGFKAINDKYGHNSADLLLGEIEKAIRHAIRTVDFIVRYGDEFVVVLPETSEKEALDIASRIEVFLSRVAFVPAEGVTIIPSASLGVAVLESEHLRALPEKGEGEIVATELSGIVSGVDAPSEIDLALQDLDDLVKRADNAMYVVKHARKARAAAIRQLHSVLQSLKEKRDEEALRVRTVAVQQLHSVLLSLKKARTEE